MGNAPKLYNLLCYTLHHGWRLGIHRGLESQETAKHFEDASATEENWSCHAAHGNREWIVTAVRTARWGWFSLSIAQGKNKTVVLCFPNTEVYLEMASLFFGS